MHVPPPLIALVLGALMKTIAWVTPDLVITHPLLRPTAFVLILVGIGVAATSVAQFRLNKTTVNPLQPEKASTLVTSGIYRITRNPMYLGLLSFLLAWGLWLGSALAMVISIAFIPIMNRLQILPEERALTKRFGDTFEAYAQRTRRWL